MNEHDEMITTIGILTEIEEAPWLRLLEGGAENFLGSGLELALLVGLELLRLELPSDELPKLDDPSLDIPSTRVSSVVPDCSSNFSRMEIWGEEKHLSMKMVLKNWL